MIPEEPRPAGSTEPLGPEPPPWETFDEPARPVGGRRLLLLAAIPWTLVTLLMLRTVTADAPQAPAAPVSAVPSTGTSAPEPTPAPAPSVTTPPDPPTDPVALRFGARVAPGPGDAAAVAVVVARTWLGTVGPEPPVEVGGDEVADGDRPPVYAEHLAVEAVDLPTPDAAVVTVVAVVLDAVDGSYTSARIVRLGVPVTLDRSGARPAGDPWWLPAPDLATRPIPFDPVEDPELLTRAAAALGSAGYRDVSVHELATSPTWPLRVTATAVAPGSDAPDDHVVWLRDHLGELVVAGVLPTTQEER